MLNNIVWVCTACTLRCGLTRLHRTHLHKPIRIQYISVRDRLGEMGVQTFCHHHRAAALPEPHTHTQHAAAVAASSSSLCRRLISGVNNAHYTPSLCICMHACTQPSVVSASDLPQTCGKRTHLSGDPGPAGVRGPGSRNNCFRVFQSEMCACILCACA